MAHSQDALTDTMCKAAREGLMEVCTLLQIEKNPQMAQLAASLGATVKAGLIGTEGKGEARNLAKTDAPTKEIV